MKGIEKIVGMGICLLSYTGCIEKFNPAIEKYNDLMVVDALLTNLPGPHTVKLSKSYAYGGDSCQMISGASVVILDKSGNEENLTESSYGVDTTCFMGKCTILMCTSRKCYDCTVMGSNIKPGFWE